MIIWRLVSPKWSKLPEALNGGGGLIEEGRWHSVGRPVIYGSVNSSLSSWEKFINLDLKIDQPMHEFVFNVISIPDDLEIVRLSANDLLARASDWRAKDNAICRSLGDDWLRNKSSLLLEVPSAVNPLENNILINPLHSDMARIRDANLILPVVPCDWDPRVLARIPRQAAAAATA